VPQVAGHSKILTCREPLVAGAVRRNVTIRGLGVVLYRIVGWPRSRTLSQFAKFPILLVVPPSTGLVVSSCRERTSRRPLARVSRRAARRLASEFTRPEKFPSGEIRVRGWSSWKPDYRTATTRLPAVDSPCQLSSGARPFHLFIRLARASRLFARRYGGRIEFKNAVSTGKYVPLARTVTVIYGRGWKTRGSMDRYAKEVTRGSRLPWETSSDDRFVLLRNPDVNGSSAYNDKTTLDSKFWLEIFN